MNLVRINLLFLPIFREFNLIFYCRFTTILKFPENKTTNEIVYYEQRFELLQLRRRKFNTTEIMKFAAMQNVV